MHVVQKLLHRLMVLREDLGLLIKGRFAVPMREAQAIVVVEFANAFLPRQGPSLECLVATPCIEKVPTDMDLMLSSA